MAKHMTLSQRIIIEEKLNEGYSFRNIALEINMSHTTLSREVSLRRIFVKGNTFNRKLQKCDKLSKAPFVCNGCPNKKKCKFNKFFYYAKDANDDYKTTLVQSREGIDFEQPNFRNMDKIIKSEVDLGHSFYMIVQDHPEFDVTERTLYNYQEKGYLSTKNIDLPRKVRYKKRKRNVPKNKSDRKEANCTIGRTYDLFKKEVLDAGITFYAEMDTVEGIKGHSCLLTFCILPYDFLIAFKIESQTIAEVTDKVNNLKEKIGYILFHQIFKIILTDNGKEFKRPDLIEDNGPDVQPSKVYFCESRRSDQKGTIEVTHEYIRRYVEQGESFDDYSQDDIDLMVNHINNTKRKALNGNTPYDLLKNKIGIDYMEKLNYYYIDPKDIILKPDLIKHNK